MDDDSRKGVTGSLLYAVVYLHALLPFWLLYLLSDILFMLVYYLVRYRRKLVRKNLENSFPGITKKEVTKIEHQFYHHLCDYFVETIKTLHLSEEEASRRMRFENPEIINRLTKEGKSCLLSLGHYGNWEWVPAIVTHFRPGVEQGIIYKKLHSQAFDQLFLRIRSRFSSRPLEMKRAFRKMIRLQQDGRTMVVGFLTDQRPPGYLNDYWTTFLNQDTLVQTGMEKIARHLGMSVVYLDITKVKRGHYVGKICVISNDASQETEFAIMERYMRKLEENILKEPAYYLWSHNRWKFQKKTGKGRY